MWDIYYPCPMYLSSVCIWSLVVAFFCDFFSHFFPSCHFIISLSLFLLLMLEYAYCCLRKFACFLFIKFFMVTKYYLFYLRVMWINFQLYILWSMWIQFHLSPAIMKKLNSHNMEKYTGKNFVKASEWYGEFTYY